MTPEVYNRMMTKTIRDLERGDVMPKIAAEALTMIKQRVQQTGTNAKGSKYAPYSTSKMLTNCSTMTLSACSKIAGSKEKRKELGWVTINGHRLFNLPGGYKQFRELHGRQTNFVDFSFTNAMWNDINVISKDSDHKRGVAIIGAKQEMEKKKLSGNTKRRGDILDLSPKEIYKLYQTYNLNSIKIFRQNGL